MAEITFLRSIEGFRSLTQADAARLCEGSERRTFAEGETILRRGDAGEEMFVLLEGAVEVRVTDDDGRLRFTTHLARGDLFGEMALLTGERRTADVVAVEPCECLVLGRAELASRLGEHPALAAFLTEIVGKRILESDALRKVGKYHLLGEVGRGSMAIVFRGYHESIKRPVAIKMLSHALVSQPGMRERFRDEARLLASLRHDHIVQVYDLEEAAGTWFLVMEWLEGMDLERWIKRKGPLDPADLRRVIYEIAAALGHAHTEGVVHRDVKPANVFRLPDGACRLVDFGIATTAVDRAGSETRLFCSPAYVAPEAVRGEAVDGRADIYSLGITAFRLLTGQLPFPHRDVDDVFDAQLKTPFPDPRNHVADVPADIAEFILRCTQKAPEERFQTAVEIMEFLAPGLTAGDSERCGTVVWISGPGQEREQVAAAVDELKSRLATSPGVEIEVRTME